MQYGGLRMRHELKYSINTAQYIILRSKLAMVMRRDTNALNPTGYHLRSLYFDDVYDTALNDKESGVFHRAKYRIRIYDKSPETIKLEKKEKVSEYISKASGLITQADFYAILNGDTGFLFASERPLLRDFYIATKTRLLTPRVIVDYEREAFTYPAGNVRVTFDKNLRAGIGADIFSPDVVTTNALDPDTLIMEVKYDDYLPAAIRRVIRPETSNYMALSKYVLCRKALSKIQYGSAVV